jgi:hypothetical protein
MKSGAVEDVVTIPLDVAVAVCNAFLPLNPNKLRTASAEVKAASHAFKDAVGEAEQRNALRRDCPTCQKGNPCTRHPR